MSKPKLLDLYCKAGGAGTGYSQAGFEVVGVDIEPQPHYPFEFYQADALTFPLEGFDAYHASPPCQFAINQAKNKPANLIAPTRDRLLATGKPYVIENIPRARKYLVGPFYLCGTMFGLRVKRHRLFEANFTIDELLPPCACKGRDGFTNSHNQWSSFDRGARLITIAGKCFDADDGRAAMGIDYMTAAELAEAIPPAYTRFIGRQIIRALAWGRLL